MMNNGMKVEADTIGAAAIGLLGNEDYKEAKAQRERYCDMIALYEETDGNAGWPAYDGDCK